LIENRHAGLEPGLTPVRGGARSGGLDRDMRVPIFFPRHDRGERIAPDAGRVAVRGVGLQDRADGALKLVEEIIEVGDGLRRRDLALLDRGLDHPERFIGRRYGRAQHLPLARDLFFVVSEDGAKYRDSDAYQAESQSRYNSFTALTPAGLSAIRSAIRF